MIFYEKTEWGEQRGVKPFLVSRLYAGVITTAEFIEKFEQAVRQDCAKELEQVRGERDETAKELNKANVRLREYHEALLDSCEKEALTRPAAPSATREDARRLEQAAQEWSVVKMTNEPGYGWWQLRFSVLRFEDGVALRDILIGALGATTTDKKN